MDDLCTFKIKIGSQNSEYGCTKHQWPYANHDQDAKPQLGTSSILKSPKSGLKGHGWSFHLQNQDREQKFRLWMNQRPMTISKSISGWKPPIRNFSILQTPKLGLKEHGYFLHLQNQDRDKKFGKLMYQRPVNISKSISGCRTPVRNLQCPPKPQIRT